jgi:N-acetyl-alpha-D-muramate 1-phosphate uridylyltransferase
MTGIQPRQAVVLAAGLGTRMRPLTDARPKPLLEVAGLTLLDRILDRLEEAGVELVAVNTYHLAGQIHAHLSGRRSPKIVFSDETELLETGGGVRRALGLLKPEPFLVVNGDELWLDGPQPALQRLSRAFDSERMDALLLLHPTAFIANYEGRGDYFLDPNGRLQRRREGRVAPFLFAGMEMFHPRLFDGAPDGAFSLNLLYDRAEADGKLYGLRHDGELFHISTPADLAYAEDWLARGRRPTI